MTSSQFTELWLQARESDRSSATRPAMWEACQEADCELIEFPAGIEDDGVATRVQENARRIALCFAQQKLGSEQWAAVDAAPRARRPVSRVRPHRV